MRTSSVIDRLSHRLKPVRRRTGRGDLAALVTLFAVELGLFLAAGMTRPDMQHALHLPSFWWKLGSLGLISLLGGSVAIRSLDPTRSPRRGLRSLLGLILLCLTVGGILELSGHGFPSQLLDWNLSQGLHCVGMMILLSVPASLGLGLVVRRGAPTDRHGTALSAGIAAATWGAFVFVFACPLDDPFIIAVWYSIGCGALTLMNLLAMRSLTHW
jgi:hypothetical protein